MNYIEAILLGIAFTSFFIGFGTLTFISLTTGMMSQFQCKTMNSSFLISMAVSCIVIVYTMWVKF